MEMEMEMERRDEKRRKVEIKSEYEYEEASVEGLSELVAKYESDQRKKFLCVFFKFKAGPVLYALYAYVIDPSDFINNLNPSPPSPPVTILEMPRDDKFPIGLTCVELGSRIYFLGGQCKFKNGYYAFKKVYYLDFNTFRDKLISTTTTTTSGGGGSLINYDELSECPNMNWGKFNPIVMTANGKLYVLTCRIARDSNTRTLGSPPDFNATDWTTLDSMNPCGWKRCAFEVYDPVTDKWTILPLPSSYSSPAHILPSYCYGHTVVHDKIFLCNLENNVAIFDLKTQNWKFFDNENIVNNRAQTYDDALAHALLRNPITGRGLVLNDTLYAFTLRVGLSTFSAYHIPDHLEDTSISCASLKLTSSFPFKSESKSGLYALQSCFFYLGNDNFCSVYCEFPEVKFTEEDYVEPSVATDVYFVVLQLFKERSCSSGRDINWWSTSLSRRCKVQGIDADSGSILDFFTL